MVASQAMGVLTAESDLLGMVSIVGPITTQHWSDCSLLCCALLRCVVLLFQGHKGRFVNWPVVFGLGS